jgi:hypothetical protein
MYVIFLIDPMTGNELYASRDAYFATEMIDGVKHKFRKTHKEVVLSKSRSKALEFESARLAYQFGQENKLDDMKVGYRTMAKKP